MSEYRYRTVSPKQNSIRSDEVDLPLGHRMGYMNRRSLVNDKDSMYHAYCMCGWKDLMVPATKALYWRTLKSARLAFDNHVREVMKQGVL